MPVVCVALQALNTANKRLATRVRYFFSFAHFLQHISPASLKLTSQNQNLVCSLIFDEWEMFESEVEGSSKNRQSIQLNLETCWSGQKCSCYLKVKEGEESQSEWTECTGAEKSSRPTYGRTRPKKVSTQRAPHSALLFHRRIANGGLCSRRREHFSRVEKAARLYPY